MKIVVTQPARRDIRGIVGYIAKDNPRAAAKFADDLAGKFTTLSEAPQIGPEQADFGEGVRLLGISHTGFSPSRSDSSDSRTLPPKPSQN